MPRVISVDLGAHVADPLTVAGVYRAHANQVARWAARLGGPRIDPDDVVQEVFAVVSRKLDGFRGEAKLETWLFRITDRVIRNHRRRSAVRRILVGWSDDLAESAASDVPTPLEQLEARQRAERAYAVLDRLGEKYRRVLILFELEELSGEEIAALLGANANTVRVWLHRAREKFLACQRALEETEDAR